MPKPLITKRTVKGAALNYQELDDNFQNIIDSILTVTDGVSDINLELIDTLEFVGDHNIVITATPSGNLVTVDNEIPVITQEPTGFENLQDSSLDFDDSTRTFTIQLEHPENFAVFVSGEEYLKTASESIVIPDVTALYLIVYDNTGTLQYKTGYLDFDAEAPVAHVYWNATTAEGRLAEQRHGVTMDWATHEYLHRTRGAAFANGLAISNYTTSGDGTADADAQFDLSNGTFFDEDLKFQITHSNTPTLPFEQDLQGPARIPVAYHLGSTGEWVFDTATDYAVKVGTAIATYNLNTAGTWTTPDITSTHFVAMWIVATNFINEPIVAIMGQRSDNKLDDAKNNNTWVDLDLTYFPSEEFRPLYRIIFRSATTYTNTPKSYIAAVTDFRQTVVGGGSAAAVAPSSFGTIAVAGQNPVIADSVNDTLTLAAGTGITITTNDATDTITITNTSTASNTFGTIAVAGQSNVVADSSSDTLTLVGSGIAITTDAATDTITFTSTASGVVNTGAAGRLAFYPSAGTAVDDTGITYTGGVTDTLSTSPNLTIETGIAGASALTTYGTKLELRPNTGNAVLTTTSATALLLNNDSGTNTSSILIGKGTNSDITLTTTGTGDVLVAASELRVGLNNTASTIKNWGTASLTLRTDTGGDIILDPQGSDRVIIDNTTLYFNASTSRSTIRSSGRLTLECADGGNAVIEIGDQDSDDDIALIPGTGGQVNIRSAITELGPSTTGGNVDLRLQAANNLRLTAWSGGLINGASITLQTGTNADIELTPLGTGKIILDGLNWPTADGTNGQVLTTNGSGQLTFSTVSGGGGITDIVQDTTPQLGGNLDVNGNSIVSVSNGNIVIAPNGTGMTMLNNIEYHEKIHSLGTTSGTITPNVTNGNVQTITLNGNLTFSAFASPIAGQSLTLIINTNGTNRTLTSTMLFAGGSKTLSTTNTRDIISVFYDGTTYYASLVKDYK